MNNQTNKNGLSEKYEDKVHIYINIYYWCDPQILCGPLTVIAINWKDLHNIHIFSVVHALISFVYIFSTVSQINLLLMLLLVLFLLGFELSCLVRHKHP